MQQQSSSSSSPPRIAKQQLSPSLKGTKSNIKVTSSSSSWMLKWGLFMLGLVVLMVACINPFILLREAATGSLSSYHKRKRQGQSVSSTFPTLRQSKNVDSSTSVSQYLSPTKSSSTTSKAYDIILKAYNDSYALLVNYCPKDSMLRECMSTLFQTGYEDATLDVPTLPSFPFNNKKQKQESAKGKGKTQNNSKRSDASSINNNKDQAMLNRLKSNPPPWWFYTMLRDGSSGAGQFKRDDITYINGGLHGLWHEAVTETPNVSMCLIEKVGNTQWRKIFFAMNDAGKPGSTKKMPFLPQRYKPQTRVKLPMPKDTYPSFVFLRDPLERFLSAYMDKCFKLAHRSTHQHCEPNILHDNKSTRDTLMKGIYDPDDGSILRKKEAFELYVDTVPLRWNMHFFPLSLYCNGLYRTIDEYDYVGKMDENFYKDIDYVAHRYGGRFETEVHKVFDADDHIEKGTQNVGVETSAPKYVKEFYTKRSLIKVLEYVSIDYIFLNLDVPQWAHDMLAEG